MLWRKKTDDEYVGVLRKLFFGWSKPMALLHAFLSLAGAALSFILIQKIRATNFVFGEDFELGFLFGAFAVLVFLAIVANAVIVLVIFFKPRSIRLLVEYHQRLQGPR